ncbi:MAG: flagellar biosynthesis protein FlhB [Phycisphaerales bacterium]|jgi:flagellar biosynthetic protein FlhB|nr:flagellar biosynthesis protein FlhB [Phycisphaerales bacterium]
MADDMGERTEQPTPKRLRDARREGNVAKSTDLSGAVDLISAAVLVLTLGSWIGARLFHVLERALSGEAVTAPFDPGSMGSALLWGVGEAATVTLPAMGILILVGFVTQLLQVGWSPTTKPLMPKLSKLSPISGIKRILGPKGAVKSAMGIAKVSLLGIIMLALAARHLARIARLPLLDMPQAMMVIGSILLEIVIWLLAVLLVLGIIDMAYQKWQHVRDLRMTKHQVKDERRSMEGDPEVRRRRLKMAMQIAMQRVNSAVPTADVVVTNPTHFSVALAYDEDRMRAPRVVAKGADQLAFRIRQLAMTHGVPIVERPPLARALYWGVPEGTEISPEHYEAVAEILAYVYRLEGEAAKRREERRQTSARGAQGVPGRGAGRGVRAARSTV